MSGLHVLTELTVSVKPPTNETRESSSPLTARNYGQALGRGVCSTLHLDGERAWTTVRVAQHRSPLEPHRTPGRSHAMRRDAKDVNAFRPLDQDRRSINVDALA